MEILGPMIEHEMKASNANQPIFGMPFQILGFDFMIDKNLKTWLLEINDHPSLDIYFDKDGINSAFLPDEYICPVDLHVKSTVVKDTVKLMMKSKKKIEKITLYKSLMKCQLQGNPMFSVVKNLRSLFYAIASVTKKQTITTTHFEKLV